MSLSSELLLELKNWPRTGFSPHRLAMGVVRAGPDRWSLVARLQDAQHAQGLPEDAKDALRIAARALTCVSLDQHLTDSEQQLVQEAIESIPASIQKDRHSDSVRKLIDTASGAEGLQGELVRQMLAFLGEQAAQTTATFSLILFNSSHHDGAVLKSFREDSWESILIPLRDGDVDSHLALVPPPRAAGAVRRLASLLGAPTDKPCVVFLGQDFSLQTSFLQRRAICVLQETAAGGEYTEQLSAIYESVYGNGAVAAGALAPVIIDRTIARVAEHPWFWLGAAAASLFGAHGLAAVQLIEAFIAGDPAKLLELGELITDALSMAISGGPDLQIINGTVWVHQNPGDVVVGEMYVHADPDDPSSTIEHWVLAPTFQRDKGFRLQFKPEAQWYTSYTAFRSSTQPLMQQGYRYHRSYGGPFTTSIPSSL